MYLKEILNESVPVTSLQDRLINSLTEDLKPIALRRQEYTPNNLKSEINNSLKKNIKDIGKEKFGIPKTYDLKVKTFIKNKEREVSGSVSRKNDEILLKIFIPKENLKKSLEDTNNLARLLKVIIDVVMHETTHIYQWYYGGEKLRRRSGELGKFIEPGKGTIVKKDDPRYLERYLSDRQEIEAHAAEAFSGILSRYGHREPEKAYEEFKNNFNPKIIEVVNLYWDYFGSKKESVLHQRIWRKFLKKLNEKFEDYFKERSEDEF